MSVDVFEQHRPVLLQTAYRMLGRVAPAEDVVQEAYLRWRDAPSDDVRSPRAYLVKTVTRLALDRLRDVRPERREYPGPWLPEPVRTDGGSPLGRTPEQADAGHLTLAFLRLLETLTPEQRAAFLLREAFDFGYAEIADVVDSTEAGCRQHVSRARRRLEEGRTRYEASREDAEELRSRFLAAAREGDLDGLLEVLAEDAVLRSDGGGEVPAARRPVTGARDVARLLVGVLEDVEPGLELAPAEINGEPGVIARREEEVISAVALVVDGGRIRAVLNVLNPEKLGAVEARPAP